MNMGNGMMLVLSEPKKEAAEIQAEPDLAYFSRLLMDPKTGLAYKDPAPHDFSFNSPMGACPYCHGLGTVTQVDRSKIMPDMKLSIAEGGIVPIGKKKQNLIFAQIEALLSGYGYTLNTPLEEISPRGRSA
jgi:excinuclease ABC subunit A